MPVVLYGIAPCDPEESASEGYRCTCEDAGTTFCYDQCDPGTYTSFNPGFACHCTSNGSCTEYALDGGSDGG
jgi:hypothetical protein